MKQNLNLIILDIDGVMNNENYYHNGPNDLMDIDFDPKSVKLLNNLVEYTKAKIIISSDWRKERALDELKRIFEENKVIGEIIGVTPILKFSKKMFKSITVTMPRGLEIQQALINIQRVNPEHKINYIILDDDISGMLLSQKLNIVRIDPVYGLTPSKFTMALHILKEYNLFDTDNV